MPLPLPDKLLYTAFSDEIKQNSKEAIEWEELFAKLEGIGICFNKDMNQFNFVGQDKIHVSLIDIEVDESQQDYEPPIFIYYENKNEKFILAKQQTYDKYAHLISGYQGQNFKWISHNNDLDLDDYCYQVLSQIQDGKDVENLEFCSAETASVESDSILETVSIDSLSSYKTAIDQDEITSANSQFSFFGMKRDTCINGALFTLSAACMVVFGFTMAGPAFLVGLFLFAALLNRIISSNSDKTSSLSV